MYVSLSAYVRDGWEPVLKGPVWVCSVLHYYAGMSRVLGCFLGWFMGKYGVLIRVFDDENTRQVHCIESIGRLDYITLSEGEREWTRNKLSIDRVGFPYVLCIHTHLIFKNDDDGGYGNNDDGKR